MNCERYTTNEFISHIIEILNYKNININHEESAFIIKMINQYTYSDNENEFTNKVNKFNSFDHLICEIKNSEQYKLFITNMNDKIKRSCELSSFIESNNFDSFYNKLNYHELNIIKLKMNIDDNESIKNYLLKFLEMAK
jgi:hypothetical protein